jgi:hypothetical protein
VAEKETTLVSAQNQLQQDRTMLEGVRSWQAQAKKKAQEAEKLSAGLQEKVTSLAVVEE